MFDCIYQVYMHYTYNCWQMSLGCRPHTSHSEWCNWSLTAHILYYWPLRQYTTTKLRLWWSYLKESNKCLQLPHLKGIKYVHGVLQYKRYRKKIEIFKSLTFLNTGNMFNISYTCNMFQMYLCASFEYLWKTFCL